MTHFDRDEAMSDGKITENQGIMMKLIYRSPDLGNGWRQVSNPLWRHVLDQSHPDLTEIDHDLRRVRFTPEGDTIMRYLP